MLDRRLRDIVIKSVDVSYGGENGFNQAIALSAESLSNVKFIQERELINRYFEEINQDTGKFCFGVKDTMTVRLSSRFSAAASGGFVTLCLPGVRDERRGDSLGMGGPRDAALRAAQQHDWWYAAQRCRSLVLARRPLTRAVLPSLRGADLVLEARRREGRIAVP